MRCFSEDDTYRVLRGASYREMFLILTEDIHFGDDLVAGKEHLLIKNGWTMNSFVEVFLNKYKTPLDLRVITDLEWRVKFLAEDDGGR